MAVEARATPPRQRGIPLVLKTCFDRTVAAVALTLSAPLMLAIGVAIRVSMGRPLLFTQERPGRGGRNFRVLKFRTMRDARGVDGCPLPDGERLTPLGRFLRASSLDELPQFWNVLKGDLSLVGPRPLLPQYLARYDPEQARRHDVLPGITGWSQVNGRNAISWEEKLALDVWYVDHWSLALDAKILLKTASVVLRQSSISNPEHATMPEFRGAGESKP
jgi:lipopolysaccharide/colanic/teichoic acid biosynthesis glycosyltransferase